REARDRMELLCRSSDGFVIAEEDLAVRGPGEMYGTRQHGLPDLRIANLVKDSVILEAARKEAFLRIQEDPEIAAPGNRRWFSYLEKKYPGAAEVIH
ncbi:MAG: DNA helicase RecG, partial [Armatimonadetes bacterium]|nr:DNA helicase RecG [Armatimonadota bacterium]